MRGADQAVSRVENRSRRLGRRLGPRWLLGLCGLLVLGGCGVLPDEFNLSPLYRHRIDPAGNLVELDVLWPLVHWEQDEAGTTDTRLRPLWRRVCQADGEHTRHEFLVPFGEARSDPEETVIRWFPLFYYREHLHEGKLGFWDRDWWLTPLIWGGSSATGENYLAVFPIYGSIPQFLSYDRFSFLLFPLALWTQKGDTSGTHLLWPLIGWGGADDPRRPHWWRILPFYSESIRPGKSESYSTLWPFFHWGRSRLDKKQPYDEFFFFPIFGWKSGGAFLSWTFLWPFFRHGHSVAEDKDPLDGKPGTYSFWDMPWPLFRILDDTWSDNHIHQWWITPLISMTRTLRQESLVILLPLIWLRSFWDKSSLREDTYVLPFFWKNRKRYKKKEFAGTYKKLEDDAAFETAEDYHWRVWPLADWREDREGNWRLRALDPYPWDNDQARGIRPAWDWVWTLASVEGDARGNRRVGSFANIYTSRNFAGRRFQMSVPLLFNYTSNANGGKTLRLLQFFPISWGGPSEDTPSEDTPSEDTSR